MLSPCFTSTPKTGVGLPKTGVSLHYVWDFVIVINDNYFLTLKISRSPRFHKWKLTSAKSSPITVQTVILTHKDLNSLRPSFIHRSVAWAEARRKRPKTARLEPAARLGRTRPPPLEALAAVRNGRSPSSPPHRLSWLRSGAASAVLAVGAVSLCRVVASVCVCEVVFLLCVVVC